MNYTKIIIFTISIIVSLTSKSQYITGSITEINRNQKSVPANIWEGTNVGCCFR